MTVKFGPRIGQPMPPDIMVSEGGGCERRPLMAGADGKGCFHALSIPKGEGLRGHSCHADLHAFGQPLQRSQHNDILLKSSDEPGMAYKGVDPRVLFDPSSDFIRRLIHKRRRRVSHIRTLRIPPEHDLGVRGIPHQGKRIEPTVQRAYIIDATLGGTAVKRRADVALPCRIRNQIDLCTLGLWKQVGCQTGCDGRLDFIGRKERPQETVSFGEPATDIAVETGRARHDLQEGVTHGP